MNRFVFRSFVAGAAVVAAAVPLAAQRLDSASVAGLRWRNVGNANFMGRLVDVVGIPGPSKTIFVSAAAGGIWKSMNNGITWRPVFDDKRIASMGMLAIAPSDTNIVWTGTGEPNSRNSIEPGGGIYKSTDGGITWTLKGLEKTGHIGGIAVHPTNPNIVYVAALGQAWKTNPERGLYKTSDGGTTWQLVKFISDKAGFVDVDLDPSNPNTVWASSWERIRTPYSLKSGGPGSGLWKSTDAGATWTEVKGNGFPTGLKGRIRIDIAPSNPRIMYTMVEAQRPELSTTVVIPERNPPLNGLYRSADGGATWTQQNNINVRPFYYSNVEVDPKNADRVYFSSTQLQVSDDGGKTSRGAKQGTHIDDHAIWIDPSDPERIMVANDGGITISSDKGGNWIQGQNLPIAQYYEVSYDMAVPYNICGGAQDNGTWCGPSKRRGPVGNAYWFTIQGGDGFYAAQDPTDPNIVYGESQAGNAGRLNLKTGERRSFQKPQWQPTYRMWEDSIAVVRGDPLKAPSRELAATLTALRAQQVKDSIDLNMRYNWNSPFFISPHNNKVIYFAGNRLLKSSDQAESFHLVSPDLSKKIAAKLDTSLTWTGGITLDATGAETYGTIVTIAESPIKPGILYSGTDDGNVWKSHNDGAAWENLTARFPGLPPETYVARVEPSHFDTLTFYVAFEGHRSGDFTPYVYSTNDGGKTFKSIAAGLPNDSPADYLRALKADNRNPNLLFVGSSISVYASLDRGATWFKFAANLPSVPVYDLKIHPRDGELIAATHGRGFWIVDITPLQQVTAATVASNQLFAPKTAMQWGEAPALAASGNGNAQDFFQTPSPAYGAAISYRVTSGTGTARILISDVGGDTIANLTGPGTPGLHTVTWGYNGSRRVPVTPVMMSASERRDSILRAVRMPHVLDSLQKAKYDSASLARARELLTPPAAAGAGAGGRGAGGGGGGGGGGGRGGNACHQPLTQWEPFCARPGEAPAGGGGGGGGRGGAGGPIGPESDRVKRVFDIIGLKLPAGGGRGGGGGGRGGFGGGAPGVQNFTAGAGEYLVTLVIGSQTLKQKLRVEAYNVGAGDSGNPFGAQADNDEVRPPSARNRH